MNLEKLVEAFAQHAAAQTDAISRGDAKTGNKHARQVNATFDKLCAHGNAGRDALAALFTHPRMDVRVKAVLREAAEGKGLVSFAASESLKRWEEGTWALDPE